MRNSAAISIAALIAASTATALGATTYWSGLRKTATGDAGTLRRHSQATGAASILVTDADTDGSVDAYEG